MKSTEKLPVEANYRLKEVREALEMTREDMASLLAFSYQVYSAIERGESSLFVDRLEALKKTKANVDYVITGRERRLMKRNPSFLKRDIPSFRRNRKNLLC